jgi:hypothetical protein
MSTTASTGLLKPVLTDGQALATAVSCLLVHVLLETAGVYSSSDLFPEQSLMPVRYQGWVELGVKFWAPELI